jgi:hypothetical protein
MQAQNNPSLQADRELIQLLGGPTKLAELLGYKKPGGVQRVQNWKDRGIPASVKLCRPDLFLRHLKPRSKKNKQNVERGQE